MNIFSIIRNYFILKKQLNDGPVHIPSTYSTDGKVYVAIEHSLDTKKNVDWPKLLSEYISNSIRFYLKWLGRGHPVKIELVFHKCDFEDKIEPDIYICFPPDRIFLDYESLRYGHLLVQDRDGQRQCVCAAETYYPEFRDCVVAEEQIRCVLEETAHLVGENTQIPTCVCLVDGDIEGHGDSFCPD